MPLCNLLTIDTHTTYALWRIDESHADLFSQLSLQASELVIYANINHINKQLEWLSTRLVLQELCKKLNYTYDGLSKDRWGKPYLIGSNYHISLAHCFPFSLAAVAQHNPIGMDIQFPHKKLQRVQSKYLNKSEIKDSANNVEKLCIYWGAKEAIYKAYGGRRLSLREDISIEPFVASSRGDIQGTVKGNPCIIKYGFYGGYVLTYCYLD